jgi:hypothetical protein
MVFPRHSRLVSPVLSPLVECFLLGVICLLATRVSVCQATASEFVGSLDAPEAEVLKAVHQIVNDPIVYGTYSYEKEKQLKGARPADSVSAFGDAPDEGKLFFKVAENVLAPRHFKETADLGTIYVRYIVQGTGPGTTAIRIGAVYVEKNRRRLHQSDGTVEESEFRAIRDRLQKIQEQEKSLADTAADHAAASQETIATRGSDPPPKAVSSADDLQKRVADLRHRVEMRTASGGAALKAAPYRTAATLQPLPAQTELLVVVLTRYWYGVETTDGHRGWVHRSQVEPLP